MKDFFCMQLNEIHTHTYTLTYEPVRIALPKAAAWISRQFSVKKMKKIWEKKTHFKMLSIHWIAQRTLRARISTNHTININKKKHECCVDIATLRIMCLLSLLLWYSPGFFCVRQTISTRVHDAHKNWAVVNVNSLGMQCGGWYVCSHQCLSASISTKCFLGKI